MAQHDSTVNVKVWLHKASKLWCVKRKGRCYYLGTTEAEAVKRYERYKRRIEAGGAIPALGEDDETGDLLTVKDVCNRFLTAQGRRVDTKELSQRTFNDYLSTCRKLKAHANCLVDDLTPEDFSKYRSVIAETKNIIGTGNEVTRIKTIFKWAYESGLLSQPMRFGPDFRRPKKNAVREHRYRKGEKLLSQQEILTLADESSVNIRAMVFMGINCGFLPSDANDMRIGEVDFKQGTLSDLRTKSKAIRFATLWPETIAALELALTRRAAPVDSDDQDRFFINPVDRKRYIPAKETEGNLISKRITATLQRIKCHVPGKSFSWLRHTFRTTANAVGDDVAARLIMGHTDDRIDDHYIHTIPIERVRKITDHVRQWLFQL